MKMNDEKLTKSFVNVVSSMTFYRNYKLGLDVFKKIMLNTYIEA